MNKLPRELTAVWLFSLAPFQPHSFPHHHLSWWSRNTSLRAHLASAFLHQRQILSVQPFCSLHVFINRQRIYFNLHKVPFPYNWKYGSQPLSDVKFNKYESLKTPVLLVKLLNHFLLLALVCQQNKTDNDSFPQGTKSR